MGTTRPTTPQSLTVEYVVTGSLDGTTPAPQVQIDQNASDATPFDEQAQIFRPSAVENLGLIDPDLLVGGSIGTRCVAFLSLDTEQTGAANASLDVVGVRGSPADVFFQKQVRDLAGTTGPVFLDEGFNVPQGSDLRLRGFTAEPGGEIRVRITLLVPEDCADVAAFRCACEGATGATGPTGATGAGADNCLTQYLVSPSEEGAAYQKISDAYGAAKVDGHNAANPAQVLVCPGTYEDDVLMDTPGIDVIAVASDSQARIVAGSHGEGQTVMLGDLEIDMADAGSLESTSARWQGVDIIAEGTAAVVFSGEEAQYFYLTDCQISSDTVAIRDTNEGAEDDQTSILDIQRCRISAVEEADTNCIEIASAGQLPTRVNCSETHLRATGHAAFVSNGYLSMDSLRASSTDDCFSLDGAIVYASDSLFSTDGIFADVPAGSVVDILDCKFSLDTAPFITGAGMFYHDAMAFYRGTVPAWDTSLRARTSQGVCQESDIVEIDVSAGGYEITTETNVSVIGPGTLTVPPTIVRPGVIRLKESSSSGGAVTVAAQGVDNIRVGGETAVASVTLTPEGLFMVADPPNSLWEAWAGCMTTCLDVALVAPDTARAPFQSIQDAYDSLVAAGAGAASPGKVLVCPGVYTEDVAMSTPGIDIVGVAPDDYNELRQGGLGITRLEGTLTIDLTVAAPDDYRKTCAWRGIDIIAQSAPAPSQSAVLFTGTHFQLGFITDCYLQAAANAPAIKQDNSGSSGVLGDSALDVIRCGVVNPSVASAAGFDCLDGTLLLNDCVTRGAVKNTISAGALVSMQDMKLTNGVTVAGELDAFDSTISEIVQSDGSLVEITRCDMPAGPTGTGTFLFDSIPTGSASPVGGFDTNLTITQKSSVPQGGGVNYYTGAGPHQLDGSETNVVVDPNDEVAVVVLPPALARRGPIRLKQLAGSGGSLNVNTSGGETIDTAAAPLVGIGTAGKTFIGWVSPPFGPPNDWETYS